MEKVSHTVSVLATGSIYSVNISHQAPKECLKMLNYYLVVEYKIMIVHIIIIIIIIK